MALSTPWPICTNCQAIPLACFRNGAINKPHQLWPTYSAFANSALRGCHTCTLLYEAVQEPFKHQLNDEAVFLEHTAISSDGAQAVALTVTPASLPDPGIQNELLQNRTGDQRPNFQLVPIADVKYVLDAEDVPQGARQFKGKIRC
jgi:hypothetical protein